jgi:hypothetical protein
VSKPNLKAQAKRKRELAKLDKRQAKDQKRAVKKAERSGEPETPDSSAAQSRTASGAGLATGRAAVAAPPLTLAEAASRWKAQRAPLKAKLTR